MVIASLFLIAGFLERDTERERERERDSWEARYEEWENKMGLAPIIRNRAFITTKVWAFWEKIVNERIRGQLHLFIPDFLFFFFLAEIHS
jgi:hypothetical protein